jgi:hypothetical protein
MYESILKMPPLLRGLARLCLEPALIIIDATVFFQRTAVLTSVHTHCIHARNEAYDVKYKAQIIL